VFIIGIQSTVGDGKRIGNGLVPLSAISLVGETLAAIVVERNDKESGV